MDILGCDLCNSFCVNIIKHYSGIKRYRSKNSNLTSCIQTLNVSSRICLRISQLCSQSKSILKLHSFLRHLGQDKVCRAIYNSHNLCHMVSCKTLFQRTDDRNSSGNCRFKQKINLLRMCSIQKLMSMDSNQIFVGSYHMLSCI